MAELNRAASFAKTFQKKTGRARELLRQNLGKADKTKDEDFDGYVKNFNKQTCSAMKLLKEVKNYHACLKAMQTARNSLMEVVCDVYEPSWTEYDKVQVKSEILDRKFNDFLEAVNEHVIKDIVSYSELFPEVNKKIMKRRNKLLDYDRCRHEYENLLNNPRRKDDPKLGKAKEQMITSQSYYDSINRELHDELPALFDSRITFLAAHLEALFHAEKTYHHDASIVFNDLSNAVEKLADENRKGAYSDKRSWGDGVGDESKANDGDISSSSDYMSPQASDLDTQLGSFASGDDQNEDNETSEVSSKITPDASQGSSSVEEEKNVSSLKEQKIELVEAVVDKPKSEQPKVLYEVKAAFSYTAEDADELSFEPGDIINVIEFEDPEVQEEGWLMGYIGDPKNKGLFPSNFTKPM